MSSPESTAIRPASEGAFIMVKKWIIVGGALGLISLTSGCGAEPQEPQGEPEITGTTAQADESGMWRSYGIDSYRFTGALNHIRPDSTFFSLRYSRLGAPLGNRMFSYSGLYSFSGFDGGNLYGFKAEDCVGRPLGAAASCDGLSPTLNLYSPA